MPRIGYRLLGAALALSLLGAADAPTTLRHGVNVTHWFRYPPSRDPAALRSYLDDAALGDLRRSGFTFVRIPVQPDLLVASDALVDALARVERHGLAVVVALFAAEDWHLEAVPADRTKLLAAWQVLAPRLRRLDPALTFPEVLNEPVFPGDAAGWAALQHQAVQLIRVALPTNTIVLNGADWGSIAGLTALPPEPDPHVVYSFHLYEPAELTALGAYRPSLDETAMARLPFPADDLATCAATAEATHDPPTAALMRFYCTQRWDAAKIADRIATAGNWARLHHVFVFAGEFGASPRLNAAARLAWLGAVRGACERQGIGWALWGYDDSMGFSLHPAIEHRRFDAAMMRTLGLVDSNNHQALPSRRPVSAPP
jgi:endoglucanase